MRPPEAQRRSAAARARPKTPSIDSERRAAIAKSQVVSRTLVAGAYFEVSTCFTGVSRRSEQIIEEQQRRMAASGGEALESLHQLKRDAVEIKQALLRGEIRLMADILGRSWEAKSAPRSA